MIHLRNTVNREEIPENEQIVNIIEKIVNFSYQQKRKGRTSDLARIAHVFDRSHLRILAPKKMLQRS